MFEQVALGMAAADLQHAWQGPAEFSCRPGMVALGMGHQPQPDRQRDLLPHRAGLGPQGVGLDVVQ